MAKMATLENLEAKISFSRPTMVCVLEGGGEVILKNVNNQVSIIFVSRDLECILAIVEAAPPPPSIVFPLGYFLAIRFDRNYITFILSATNFN